MTPNKSSSTSNTTYYYAVDHINGANLYISRISYPTALEAMNAGIHFKYMLSMMDPIVKYTTVNIRPN